LVAVAFEDLSDAFVTLHEGKVSGGDWILKWVCEEPPAAAELSRRLVIGVEMSGYAGDFDAAAAVWSFEEIEDKNWLVESYNQFPPFSVGPFFIYGSHYDGDVPKGQSGLQIDAATAFGTGEHGTTKGCLELMLGLKDDGACPWNILDMGTGSGILAIAAWKLWKTPILAVDIEEESVRVAKLHQDMNGVADSAAAMQCFCGDGFETAEVQRKKPFDLIIANILAGPLIDMAHDMAAVADDKAYVILSGMLTTQVDSVKYAYISTGFKYLQHIDYGEWSSLLLQK